MDNLVRRLSENDWVLDVGAGPGSFDYSSTPARVVSLDLAFPSGRSQMATRIAAPADRLPFRSGVVEVVVCNHSLEHFPNPRTALAEIARVLKSGGFCWVAIPDGYSLDDRLYRFLFAGGGHVSHFTLESFLKTVNSASELNLVSFKVLYSGFVYLAPPDEERLRHFPQPARTLFSVVPDGGIRLLARWVAFLTRIADQRLGTGLSRYGYGFVLQKGLIDREIRQMPDYVNVCVGCGAGHSVSGLAPQRGSFGIVAWYSCPLCGGKNLFLDSSY